MRYVEESTLVRYGEWVESQDEYGKLVLEKEEKRKMFQKQSFFGEGELVGRTLALIARANGPSSTISAIWDREGKIIRATLGIVEVFKNYYEALYSTPQINFRGGNVGVFLKTENNPFIQRG